MYKIICAVAALSMVVTGCSQPAAFEYGARIGQADQAYGRAALDKAVAEFLAPAPGAVSGGGGGGGGGGVLGIGSGSGAWGSKARAQIDYREITGQEAAFWAMLRQPVADGWAIEGHMRLGHGQTRYTVPAGRLQVGITLDEAVTLNARARYIEAEGLALRQIGTLPGGVLDVGLGAGLRATQSGLQVQTLLPIIIDSSHRQTQPYAVVQARYGLKRVPVRGFVEGRVYGRRMAGLRAGVDIGLSGLAR